MTGRTLRDASIGLVYLVVIAALIALSIMDYNHEFSTYTNVSLRTDNVGSSLQKGSDVKVRGVLVGEVTAISTDGTGAKISLRLDPSKVAALPANMSARLLPKTLFGERFVGLEYPATPSSSRLSSGDTIRQDTSRQSVELEKLFSDLVPVLQAVKPEKLAATLGEMAAALRGRSTDLALTVQTVGHYFDKLAPHIPQLTADLKAFASVADTYTQAAPDLIAGLNSLTTTSKTIAAQRNDYMNLLSSLTATAQTLDTFTTTNQQQIIGLSRDSLPSLRLVANYATEFPCLTRALTAYIPTANQAFGVGTHEPGAHVILHVVPATKPYTAADKPAFTDTGGPRCPYVPATSLASTALANVPGVQGALDVHSARTPAGPTGMGPANSPQENELIDEIVAPTLGMRPAQYPRWASLLLGPAMRGSQVTLK